MRTSIHGDTSVSRIPPQNLSLDRIDELLSHHHSWALRIHPTYWEKNIPIHADANMVDTEESMRKLTDANPVFSGDRISAANFIRKNASQYRDFFVFTLPGVPLVFVYGISITFSYIDNITALIESTPKRMRNILKYPFDDRWFRKHETYWFDDLWKPDFFDYFLETDNLKIPKRTEE